jgi:peroxiredoxin
MSELKIDDRAPDFELVGQDGSTYSLRDFRGQPVVLVFYVLDFHPVCSDEHASFVDAMPKLNRLEAQVLGISVDSRYAHTAFAKHLGITYPLLSDFQPRGMVARIYGVYQDDKGFSGRWIFVVDPEGRISYIQRNEISEIPELDDVIEAVKESL